MNSKDEKSISNITLHDFHDKNYICGKKIFKKSIGGYSNVPLFVIYENPKDFPGKYVARLWKINRNIKKISPTPYCAVKDTLEEIRKAIPHDLYRFGKDSCDDPAIIETWI